MRTGIAVFAGLLSLGAIGLHVSRAQAPARRYELINIRVDAAADYISNRIDGREVVGFSCTVESAYRCFILVR